MRKMNLPIVLILLLMSGYYSNAQKNSVEVYGQEIGVGVNSKINPSKFSHPGAETVFTVDTSVNHMDFGLKNNKGSFKTLFAFLPVPDNNMSVFKFKKSQITGTHITKNSGIVGIELTVNGFEVLYHPKKTGPVDDYVVIHTYNGDLILRLTGKIIDPKKKDG